MKNKFMLSALTVLTLHSANAFSGEVLDGDAMVKMLVGNTLQMDYPAGTLDHRRTYHEYYDPDGKIFGMERRVDSAGNYKHFIGTWSVKDGRFCTSVLGRTYDCNTYEKINETTYKIIGESGEMRNVKLYKGKHHILN